MYSRELDGKELTIGVSGMLRKNALVMYDRETETLWSHYSGEALAGPLMGKILTTVESTPRVKFGDWKKIHPNTQVLVVNGISDRQTSYRGYATDNNRLGVRPVGNKDERLPGKDVVLGLRVGESTTAVPVSTLTEKGLVTIKLGDKEVVAFGDTETGLFGAFVVPDGVKFTKLEDRQLVAEDGRSWIAMNGAGPMQLEHVAAIRTFWFAWADHYPKTDISK